MPTYIGTNFSYDSKDFLDERISKAKDKKDLREWNTKVPEGFEICLDGVWYYYSESLECEETGHWIPRVSEDGKTIDETRQSASIKSVETIRNEVNGLSENVEELNKFSNPISFKTLTGGNAFGTVAELEKALTTAVEYISSSTTYNSFYDWDMDGKLTDNDIASIRTVYNNIRADIPYVSSTYSTTYSVEVGAKISPCIRWSVISPSIIWSLSGSSVVWKVVKGTDTNLITPKSVSIVGERSESGWIGDGIWYSRSTLTSSIPTTFTYTATAESEDGQSIEGTVSFRYQVRSYCGSASKDLWDKGSLTMSNLSGFTGWLTSSGAVPKTTFNCSGGKYPYMIIPTAVYNTNLKTYMNDNLNSDFTTKTVNVLNNFGLSVPCVLIRSTYIQTGSAIGIEIK